MLAGSWWPVAGSKNLNLLSTTSYAIDQLVRLPADMQRDTPLLPPANSAFARPSRARLAHRYVRGTLAACRRRHQAPRISVVAAVRPLARPRRPGRDRRRGAGGGDDCAWLHHLYRRQAAAAVACSPQADPVLHLHRRRSRPAHHLVLSRLRGAPVLQRQRLHGARPHRHTGRPDAVPGADGGTRDATRADTERGRGHACSTPDSCRDALSDGVLCRRARRPGVRGLCRRATVVCGASGRTVGAHACAELGAGLGELP